MSGVFPPLSSSPELFISAEYLNTTTSAANSSDSLKKIPLKNLPTSVPQVVTTTNTLRRCCGFSLALAGFLFYCARILFNVIWIVCMKLKFKDTSASSTVLILEMVACVIGIGQFLRIMRKPKLTLKESNFKNVWIFALIPIISFTKIFLSEESSLILPVLEAVFFTGYIYGLSLNGRSSSFWAACKPFCYEMVPLILPVPPSSRAFPQYTVPFNKV